MKIKLVSIAMVIALTAGFNASAFHSDKSEEGDKKSHAKHGKKMHGKMMRGKKMQSEIRDIVQTYMLEQGDITQGEIDLMKAERKAIHESMKALKESGDTEALTAKKAELKEKWKARRAEVKAYIESHEDLQAKIDVKKEELKAKRKERREERKAKKSSSEMDS